MKRLNRPKLVVLVKLLFIAGTMLFLAMAGGRMRPAHANGDTDTHFLFAH